MKIKDADILIIPGLGNSSPFHWQSRWQQNMSTARRVEQDDWDNPARESWTGRVIEAVAEAYPERVALVHKGTEVAFPDLVLRYRTLGSAFSAAGIGCQTERPKLPGHESGQDHIALYLNNEFEYLESMLGGWAARAATFNVNHRYMADELLYLMADSKAKAVIVNSAYAPNLEQVLPQ